MTQFKPGDRVTHNATGSHTVTNPPDRIWAFYAPEIGDDNQGCTIVAGDRCMHGAAPYVRADIAAAEIARLRAVLETIRSASKHYARGDCDLSYAHQSTHNLAAAALVRKP